MFEITKDTQDPSNNQPIPYGINENVKLESVEFSPLKDGGDNVLTYTFADAQGRQVRKVMWNVDPERVRENAVKYPKQHGRDNKNQGYVKGADIKPDEAVQIAYADFLAYNKHILNRYFEEDVVIEKTSAKTYEEFSKKVVDLFDSLEQVPLVRLIVIPNNAGYASLPNNHYTAFIERMDVNPSGLKLNNYMQQQIETHSKPDSPEGFDSGSPFEANEAADF